MHLPLCIFFFLSDYILLQCQLPEYVIVAQGHNSFGCKKGLQCGNREPSLMEARAPAPGKNPAPSKVG